MAILGQWDSGTLPTIYGAGVSSAATGGWNGGPAIQFDQAAGQASQVRFEFTSRQNVAVRAYLQMPATWASAAEALIIVRPSSADTVGQAVIGGTGSPGQGRLVYHAGSSAATSSTGTLSQSTWYRFELRLDQANGRGRLGIFPLASDTAVWDSGWITNDFGTSAYRVEIGPAYTSPTMAMVRAANIVVSDDITNWIGRATGDGTSPGGNVLGEWNSGTLPTTIGSGVSYVANGGWDGRPAIQFTQAASDVSQVRFTFSAATNLAMRAYIQMPSTWASAGQMLLMARPSGSDVSGRMALAGTGAPGQVRLMDSAGATISSSSNGTVNTGQWYRAELQFNGTTGQGRTAVFALGSDTPLWTSGWQAADFHMPSIYAEFGPGWSGTTLGQIRMANLKVTDSISDWIGRAEGDDGSPSSPWHMMAGMGWVSVFAHEVDSGGLDPATTKLALIGDSLTASANGTGGSGREALTRAALQTTGLQNSNIYWYGRNSKAMNAADSNGKTVFNNMTDALAALGTVNIWVIALGTNNMTGSANELDDAGFAAAMRAILDTIYTSPSVTDRVIWVNTVYYNPSGWNPSHYNPIIASVIAEYPYAQVADWYTYIHSPHDDADWIYPTDGTHMTAQGYAKRDQFVANRVASLLT